jgi:uncharacterized protein
MTLLILSVLALYGGLLLMPLLRRSLRWIALLDGLIIVTVGGLVMIHLIPHSVQLGGVWALVAAGLGVVLPGILERGFARGDKRAGPWIAVLALTGLAVHALLDGAALAAPDAHALVEGHSDHSDEAAHSLLALGVLLHRLPVGLLLGLQVLPQLGWARTIGVATMMAAGTVAGFAVGLDSLASLPLEGVGIFQGLVGGMLLHIIFQHAEPGMLSQRSERIGALGGLGGVGVLVWLAYDHPIALHCAQEVGASGTFMALALEGAPALLLAFAGAGLLKAFLKPQGTQRLGRGGRWQQGLAGVTFGLSRAGSASAPLPMYQALLRRGVPVTAAVAFLVAAPALGLDALLLSVPLLGQPLAWTRLAIALVVALAVGWLIGAVAPSREAGQVGAGDAGDAGDVGGAGQGGQASARLGERLRAAARYGFVELFDRAVPWLLLGLMTASLLEPALHSGQLKALSQGWEVPLMALLGLPAYVCAAGATPLVAVLMHKGLTAGAGLAFLVTGPAVSLAGLGVLSRLHGRGVALLFGGALVGVACGLGYVVDGLSPSLGGEIALHAVAKSEHGLLHWGSLAALGALLLGSWLRRGPRGWVTDLSRQGGGVHHHGDGAHEACDDSRGCGHAQISSHPGEGHHGDHGGEEVARGGLDGLLTAPRAEDVSDVSAISGDVPGHAPRPHAV